MRGVAIHLSYTHRTVSSPSYLNQYLSNSKKNTANRTARSEYPPHGTPTPLQRPVVERQRGAGTHRPAWRVFRAIFAKDTSTPPPPPPPPKIRRKRAAERGSTGQRRRLIYRLSDTHAHAVPLPPRPRPHRCYPAPTLAQPGTRIITRPGKSE